MKSARVMHTGATLDAQEQMARTRLPIAGKVRAGIKVLTNKMAQNKKAREIYTRGLAAGVSFDDIEKVIKQKVPSAPQTILIPRNVPYFHVRQDDFSTPGAASKIIELYGEKRDEDMEPQLYSFPVIFPSEDFDMVFAETFEAWKASELFRWSQYSPEKDTLMCMKREEPVQEQVEKSQRRKRTWGPRKAVEVEPCHPDTCPLFTDGLPTRCVHHGSLRFWIPGVTGVALIELGFTSIYASLGFVEILEMVKQGLGHIKGTHDGQPIFTVSKVFKEVSMQDEASGKYKRQSQWIISLEATGLDMAQVLASQEKAGRLLEAPKKMIGHDPGQNDEGVVGGVVGVGSAEMLVKKIQHEAEIAGMNAQINLGEPVEPQEDPGFIKHTIPAEKMDSDVVAIPPQDPDPAASGEPEPQPAASDGRKSAITAARRQLTRVIHKYDPPWDKDDLKEWGDVQGYAKEDWTDPDKLREMIGKHEATQKLIAERKAELVVIEAEGEIDDRMASGHRYVEPEQDQTTLAAENADSQRNKEIGKLVEPASDDPEERGGFPF